MRNDTQSKIVIEMNHIDHANYITRALKKAAEEMSKGGDAELIVKGVNCGFIGHDVNIVKITHIIEKSPELDKKLSQLMNFTE